MQPPGDQLTLAVSRTAVFFPEKAKPAERIALRQMACGIVSQIMVKRMAMPSNMTRHMMDTVAREAYDMAERMLNHEMGRYGELPTST
jgi:hypothetical protein